MDKTTNSNATETPEVIKLSERPAIQAFPASPVLWTLQFLPAEVNFYSAGRKACKAIQEKSGGTILAQEVSLTAGIINLYRLALGPKSQFGLHEAANLLSDALKSTYAGTPAA